MSFLEEMATILDVTKPLTFVVPSSDRNLRRPKESFLESTLPTDVNMAQESKGSSGVKLTQQILKSSPLGVSYRGPIDGIMTPELSSALLTLQNKANERFKSHLTLLSGNSPNMRDINRLLEFLGAKPKSSTSPTDKPNEFILNLKKIFNLPTTQLISDFEKYFNLPVTGKISNQLIRAVQNLENNIAASIQDESVKGMIWNGKALITTPADVASALKLIKDKK